MERLTERDGYGNADIRGVSGADLQLNLDFDGFNRITEAHNRLAAYEDTGLLPEEIVYQLQNYKHWADMWKAEVEGRLMVLPCSDDVTLAYKGMKYKGDHWNPPLLTAFADDPSTKSGKRVHLFSPEEAEAALKEEQNKC